LAKAERINAAQPNAAAIYEPRPFSPTSIVEEFL
jgi:hypothetical protein